MGMKGFKGACAVLVVVTILLILLPAGDIRANPGASLSVEILSFDKIGLDHQDGPGTPEHPVGPDQSIVHARVRNDGDAVVSNVYLLFQWEISSAYVQMHGSETPGKPVGTLQPGEWADGFWVLQVARNMEAKGSTCALSITVTSQEVPDLTVNQTLTVVGMDPLSAHFTVKAQSAVNVGEIFEVKAEHYDTRAMSEIFVPLLFNRSLFELVSVRVDYYTDSTFTSQPYSEKDMYYSGEKGSSGKIPYGALRAYYTLSAISPGIDTLALLHMDVSVSAGASYNYSPNLWSPEKSHTITVRDQDFVSITGQVVGRQVMGVKLTLKDQTSQTVTTVYVDNVEGNYVLAVSPGTYSLAVDATVVDLEMMIHDVDVSKDIQEAHLYIEKYDDCPHPAPEGKLFVKAVDLDIAESLRDGITVVLHYTHGEVKAAGVWDRSLKVYHWSDSQWQLVPSVVNLHANTITFHPDSFSPFAVFGDRPRSITTFPSLGLGIASVVFVGMVAFFIRRRICTADEN